MMRIKALLALVFAFASFGPVAAHEAEPGYRKGQIHAVQAWARLSPVKGRPGAVYFTLHNESKVADALVRLSTPIAGRVEMHMSSHGKDGVMKMMPVQSTPVAADDMVMFEPRGNHIMLFKVAGAPKTGATFPLTLSFAKGPAQTIEVLVKGLADTVPKPTMDHSHHH
jgi:periplasmic copper chaperone A